MEINIKERINTYEKMVIRIEKTSKRTNYILIYYSVVMITYSLVSLIFSQAINPYLFPFFNILISVVLLVFSVINNLADYHGRISKIKVSMEELESMLLRNSEECMSDVDKHRYLEIIRNTEKETFLDNASTSKLKILIWKLFNMLFFVLIVVLPIFILITCTDLYRFNKYIERYYW